MPYFQARSSQANDENSHFVPQLTLRFPVAFPVLQRQRPRTRIGCAESHPDHRRGMFYFTGNGSTEERCVGPRS